MRSGIGLATGRGGDVGMTDAVLDRVGALQHPGQIRQHRVLRIGERLIVGTFELDADREIVAAAVAAPLGPPRMPGTSGTRDKLDQFAIAAYQEVAGNLEALNLAVVWVGTRVEAVGKQFDDAGATELARRQADVVNNQELDGRACRPVIAVR